MIASKTEYRHIQITGEAIKKIEEVLKYEKFLKARILEMASELEAIADDLGSGRKGMLDEAMSDALVEYVEGVHLDLTYADIGIVVLNVPVHNVVAIGPSTS